MRERVELGSSEMMMAERVMIDEIKERVTAERFDCKDREAKTRIDCRVEEMRGSCCWIPGETKLFSGRRGLGGSAGDEGSIY